MNIAPQSMSHRKRVGPAAAVATTADSSRRRRRRTRRRQTEAPARFRCSNSLFNGQRHGPAVDQPSATVTMITMAAESCHRG